LTHLVANIGCGHHYWNLLFVSINKTKGVRVNTPNMQKFRLEETEIEEVGFFVYLGSVVSERGGTEEDVASRINKANGVLFSCILCEEISTCQKKLKYEYSIQM